MAATTEKQQPVGAAGFFNGASEFAQKLASMGAENQHNKDMLDQELMEYKGSTFYWNRNNCRWEQMPEPLPKDDPVPGVLEFFTLDGVIDYIRANTEGLIPKDDKLILQVVNQKRVVLLSKPSAYRKERSVICACEANVPSIPFGQYMDTERFCTILLSNFIETPAREELFKVVKSMTNEQTMNTADDGVSQVITVKQGVSLAANVQFKNPVPLRPMRTFTEVDQPESNFTLRVDEKANAALFEADGGAWKNEAVARIKEYLASNLYGYNVVVIA